MPKAASIGRLEPALTELARELSLEYIGIEMCREHGSMFLRIYVDREGGMGLSHCEAFHRRVIALCEDIEYDYLEVSSPGLDRPIKTERDFERAQGRQVEVRLYRPQDGQKTIVGALLGLADGEVRLQTPQGERRFARKDVSLVKPVVDTSALDEPDEE